MESDGMIMPKWANAGVAVSNIAAATKTDRIEVALCIVFASFYKYNLISNFHK
jgi:hypothetical protein